jgi:hypothetical protein
MNPIYKCDATNLAFTVDSVPTAVSPSETLTFNVSFHPTFPMPSKGFIKCYSVDSVVATEVRGNGSESGCSTGAGGSGGIAGIVVVVIRRRRVNRRVAR